MLLDKTDLSRMTVHYNFLFPREIKIQTDNSKEKYVFATLECKLRQASSSSRELLLLVLVCRSMPITTQRKIMLITEH